MAAQNYYGDTFLRGPDYFSDASFDTMLELDIEDVNKDFNNYKTYAVNFINGAQKILPADSYKILKAGTIDLAAMSSVAKAGINCDFSKPFELLKQGKTKEAKQLINKTSYLVDTIFIGFCLERMMGIADLRDEMKKLAKTIMETPASKFKDRTLPDDSNVLIRSVSSMARSIQNNRMAENNGVWDYYINNSQSNELLGVAKRGMKSLETVVAPHVHRR